MRRLAKTFRNHNYASQRDYQTLITEKCDSYVFNNFNGKHFISLVPKNNFFSSSLLGFGGFIYSKTETPMTMSILCNGIEIFSETKILKDTWNRIGHSWILDNDCPDIFIKLEFDNSNLISLWGLSLNEVNLEPIPSLSSKDIDDILKSINKSTLKPETYYLSHNDDDFDIDLDLSSEFEVKENEIDIILKKCAYCQRVLPISTVHVNHSSFHNHKSKLTKFQNECRSCKKWNINDFFNPDRGPDKLNESSIITRERKILLREPDKILELKDRETGEGLKSKVWKKFNKKCFNCNQHLELDEFELDHTRPLAYLWPMDEYATCLCSTCNNSKHDSFPIDFYSKDKLKELSEITGLNYNDLIKKDVNMIEVNRIIDNISYFAENLDERTFKSIATKILNVRKNINLFNILKEKDINVYNSLIAKLNKRKD